MPLKKLSVIIPVYNEAATVQELLKRVVEVQLPQNITKELVVVNDSSTDNTLEKVNEFAQNNPNAEIHIFRDRKSVV